MHCILLCLNACKKQDLRNKTNSASFNDVPIHPKTAGDGLFDLLGWGYDVTQEYANANSRGYQVIDLAAFQSAHPDRVVSELPYESFYNSYEGGDARSYTLKIANTLNASVTANLPLFKNTVTAGFAGALTSSGKFDGRYIYSSYNLKKRFRHLSINSDASTLQNFLTQSFIDDVNSYYNTPATLVQKYGTHVLLDIYTGAQLDILYHSETYNANRELQAQAGLKASVKDVFNFDVNTTVDASIATSNYGAELHYQSRGGNPAMPLVGTITLGQGTPPTISTAAWENSCNTSNSVLVDIGTSGPQALSICMT